MALLLTVNKESALAEAGNSALTSSIIHGLAGTPLYFAFFAYTANEEIQKSKQRMVILSAEFGGKQSHWAQ